MSRWLWLFLSLPLCLRILPAAAQDLPNISETIDVSIVNLEVFVTDKKGNRVPGLTRDDFEIFENGKLKPISNFAEYVGEVSAERDQLAAPAPARAPRQKRSVIVFIDRFPMSPIRSGPLFSALRLLLRETIEPGDSLTIVSWNRVLVMRLPFTDDVAAAEGVLAAIEKESSFIVPDREWLENAAGFAAARGFIIDPVETLRVAGLEEATRARLEMRNKIASINGLLRSISGLDGRKAMVLVTHRFSRFAGREFLIPRGAKAAPPSPDELRFDMQSEIRSIVKTANANGVTIYPIYPEGLGLDSGISADMRTPATGGARDYVVLDNENRALSAVAQGTGGLSEWGAENIIRMLPRIQEDFDSYYSMAYRIASTGSDRGRTVVVKPRNRNYVVRSRREYVEKSDHTRMSDRVLATLARGAQGSTIDLRVRIGTVRETGRNRYMIPLTIRIPVRSLMTLPQERENAGAFSVFIGWGNVLGELGPVTEQRQRFNISREEHDGALLAFLSYEVEVLADNLTDRLAVGVFDEVSKDYGLARIELPPRQDMVLVKKGK